MDHHLSKPVVSVSVDATLVATWSNIITHVPPSYVVPNSLGVLCPVTLRNSVSDRKVLIKLFASPKTVQFALTSEPPSISRSSWRIKRFNFVTLAYSLFLPDLAPTPRLLKFSNAIGPVVGAGMVAVACTSVVAVARTVVGPVVGPIAGAGVVPVAGSWWICGFRSLS
eukprot:scaffold33338_cov49-Attheya_sp.AAC.2